VRASTPATPPPPVAPVGQLPHSLTGFIGREHERQEVARWLETGRLVTLTGPGGIGKTRLGLQVAADLLDAFTDGVFFVSLAPLRDPGLVVSTIAQTLGVPQTAGRPLLESLKEYSRDKEILLLLDNFEHLLAAALPVAELLAAAPRLKMLVTSRTLLRLQGEHHFPVPPLDLPDLKRLPPTEALPQYAAVALFIQRAMTARPEFALTNVNAPVVAEICARLDGLPLAIELAAARIRLLPPEALLARLSNRLKLLVGGARDLPARQQTLRDAIAWSYALLDDAEQRLFRRLSVFVSGCTLEAAEAVCSAPGDLGVDVLEGLASLVDKSLLRQEEAAGEPRFGTLETVREFAGEKLVASGEAAAVWEQHAGFFLDLAEKAEWAIWRDRQIECLNRLEQEHNNLRAALDWSVAAGNADVGLRLGRALGRFWYHRGHLAEGWERLSLLLASRMPPDSDLAMRGQVLNHGAVLAAAVGNTDAARTLAAESVALWRQLGHSSHLAGALSILADLALRQGELAEARSLYEQSLTLRQTHGSPSEVASSLLSLGHIARFLGDYSRARSLYEESLALGGEANNQQVIAYSLLNLGFVVLQQGDLKMADSLIRESLTIWRRQDNVAGLIRCLEGLAQLAGVAGSYTQMARLFGAAQARRQEFQLPLPQVDCTDYEGVAAARVALGEEAFAAAWEAGQALSLDEAVSFALEATTAGEDQ
jgi:predicted ATPase